MKISLVFLASLCAVALSVPVFKDGEYVESDKTFLERQKHILHLFYRIQQHDHLHPEYEEIGKTFSVYEHADSYSKPEVVKKFVQYWKYGLLPRNEIFSVMHQEHLEQAIALFKLFYYAKDWDTFYKTAVWARQHINQGMFVYSFTVALVHRPDTRHFMLPPIYEVFPHHFFSSHVIHEAEVYKQIYTHPPHDKTYHTIESNYSGWYLNLHPEQSMSYYLEDIGINAFWFYYHIYCPSWMSSEEFGWTGSRRGEVSLYLIQQITARFYAERICNEMGEIPFIDWDESVETSYEPSLVYANGLPFPSRPKFANLHEYFYNYGQKWSNNVYGYSHNFVQDYERRINDAVDSGYILTKEGKMVSLFTEDGMNVFGNILQANADSPNNKYYGPMWYFACHLLGYSWQPLDQHKLVPSALEHFTTQLRDPVAYQLMKKFVLKVQRYMSHVAPYTEKDLVLPGVKVKDMKIDDLITYDDYFYSDLSNAVFYHPEEKHDFRVRVRQTRLNHKPFTVKYHVTSDKEQKVSVKLYMAPKHDEWGRPLNLTENRLNMVELDHAIWELKSGDNEIVRHSHDFRWYVEDRMSHGKLYDSVVSAIEHNTPLHLDGRQNYFYFPTRYMLPKGTPSGCDFQFVVIVYPWEGNHIPKVDPHSFIAPGTSEMFVDHKPLHYPFDRFIKFEKMWYQIPNIYFHDEKIYHKEVHEINSPHH